MIDHGGISCELVSSEFRWTSLIIDQHWLGAARQQAIIWANGDPNLCPIWRHYAKLCCSKFAFVVWQILIWFYFLQNKPHQIARGFLKQLQKFDSVNIFDPTYGFVTVFLATPNFDDSIIRVHGTIFHYFQNRCSMSLRTSLIDNLCKYRHFFSENTFESHVCKMPTILFKTTSKSMYPIWYDDDDITQNNDLKSIVHNATQAWLSKRRVILSV